MPSTSYSAIYSFGDSLSDAGDAYLLTSSALGGLVGLSREPVSPPYAAETYNAPGGGTLTADVFSNGPVWVQDLARALGLATPGPGDVGLTASSLKALISSEFGGTAANIVVGAIESADNLTGADPYIPLLSGAQGGTDFAIGGSVTGITGFNGASSAVTDLSAQIASFEHEYPTPQPGALYTVWSGSNDVLNLLESPQFISTSIAFDQADVAQAAANEVAAVQALVANGAQTVLVGNVPNLGIIPAIQALSLKEPALPATATAFAQLFNADLTQYLAATNFGTASVRQVDVNSLISSVQPGQTVQTTNGPVTITNTTTPVYTGSFSANNGALTTSSPGGYLFFDQQHPTATGHAAVAQLALTTLGATAVA